MSRLFIIRKYNSSVVYLVREAKLLSEYYYQLGNIVRFNYKKKLTNKIIKHLVSNENYYRKSILHGRPHLQYSCQSLTKEDVFDAFCFSEDKFYIKEFNIKWDE